MVECIVYMSNGRIYSFPDMVASPYLELKEWLQSWYLISPGIVLSMCIKKFQLQMLQPRIVLMERSAVEHFGMSYLDATIF